MIDPQDTMGSHEESNESPMETVEKETVHVIPTVEVKEVEVAKGVEDPESSSPGPAITVDEHEDDEDDEKDTEADSSAATKKEEDKGNDAFQAFQQGMRGVTVKGKDGRKMKIPKNVATGLKAAPDAQKSSSLSQKSSDESATASHNDDTISSKKSNPMQMYRTESAETIENLPSLDPQSEYNAMRTSTPEQSPAQTPKPKLVARLKEWVKRAKAKLAKKKKDENGNNNTQGEEGSTANGPRRQTMWGKFMEKRKNKKRARAQTSAAKLGSSHGKEKDGEENGEDDFEAAPVGTLQRRTTASGSENSLGGLSQSVHRSNPLAGSGDGDDDDIPEEGDAGDNTNNAPVSIEVQEEEDQTPKSSPSKQSSLKAPQQSYGDSDLDNVARSQPMLDNSSAMAKRSASINQVKRKPTMSRSRLSSRATTGTAITENVKEEPEGKPETISESPEQNSPPEEKAEGERPEEVSVSDDENEDDKPQEEVSEDKETQEEPPKEEETKREESEVKKRIKIPGVATGQQRLSMSIASELNGILGGGGGRGRGRGRGGGIGAALMAAGGSGANGRENKALAKFAAKAQEVEELRESDDEEEEEVKKVEETEKDEKANSENEDNEAQRESPLKRLTTPKRLSMAITSEMNNKFGIKPSTEAATPEIIEEEEEEEEEDEPTSPSTPDSPEIKPHMVTKRRSTHKENESPVVQVTEEEEKPKEPELKGDLNPEEYGIGRDRPMTTRTKTGLAFIEEQRRLHQQETQQRQQDAIVPEAEESIDRRASTTSTASLDQNQRNSVLANLASEGTVEKSGSSSASKKIKGKKFTSRSKSGEAERIALAERLAAEEAASQLEVATVRSHGGRLSAFEEEEEDDEPFM